MAGLTVNGLDIPALADGGVKRAAPLVIGSVDMRSFHGDLLALVRARKEGLSISCALQSPSEAAALRRWVTGDGHSWSFDLDISSSRGLLPSAYSTVTVGVATSISGKHGYPAKVSNYATWLPQLGNAWTIILWRYNGTGWDHWIISSSTTTYNGYALYNRWKNGAASTDAFHFVRLNTTTGGLSLLSETNAWTNVVGGGSWKAWSWVAGAAPIIGDYTIQATGLGYNAVYKCVDSGGAPAAGDIDFTTAPNFGDLTDPDSSGQVFINDGRVRTTGQTYGLYDDMVAMPYVLPTTWIATIYATHSATAWSALPAVRVEGEFLSGSSLNMEGQLDEATVRPAAPGGTWSLGAQDLAVTFREV